jgi:hypothetical protein
MLSSKDWNERFKMAIALSIGYAIGSVLVIWFMR